ncbi:retinol dehydrogenase 12-like [Camelus dromedarius]|uniref:retinol dehydrogenase 12-like n=1 Tax=Camelus dromedarius TaxID=9838 RepID=UPI00311953E1
MSLWFLLSTPVWGPGSVLLTVVLLLRLSVCIWCYLWDLQHCSTDLTGKTAVVTGANSGIGKSVSQELAHCGVHMILACCSHERGQQALAQIRAASQSNQLLLGEVDVSSMASIRSFAQWLLHEHPEIHLLVNNAAVCASHFTALILAHTCSCGFSTEPPYILPRHHLPQGCHSTTHHLRFHLLPGLPTTRTPEGLDVTFATSYTGPFLLTNLLQGALQRAGAARVVNVSSFRQEKGYIDEEHLTGAGRPLTFNQNYDCSKLLLASFTGKLAQRLQGTGVTVNSGDPGVVYTEIMKNFSWLYRFIFWLLSFFFKNSKQGAVPVLYLSLAKELDGISGKHFSSSGVIALAPKAARDLHVAQSLWDTSA